MDGERVESSEARLGELDDDQPVVIDESGDVRISDDGDSIRTVRPETVAWTDDDNGGPAPKRRGRKPGTRNTSTKASKQATADLTQLLYSLHFMVSKLTKIDELELEEKEAERLGGAINRVNELYGNIVLTEKQQAWMNLGIVAGTIYGPRFVARSFNKKAGKTAKPPVTIDAEPVRVNGGTTWPQ